MSRWSTSGFTLIELVTVIAILGILAGVFIRYFDEGNRMFDQVDARKELMQEARMVLLRIVREVRQVRSVNDVLTANANNISFYSMSDSLVAINYSGVPGSNITLTQGTLVNTLASGVDSLALTYFKADASAAVPLVSPSATDIHRVTIFLRVARGGKSISLKTATHLRNM